MNAAMTDAPGGANPVERLARITHASVVVTGTIYAQGDSLRFQSSVVDARSGREILPLDVVMAPKSDPMIGIDALRERLLGAMSLGADVGRGILLRAPRFSAYQEHLKGEEMFTRNQVASRAFFERAIAMDSTIVPAYTMLAVTYSNAGVWDSAEAITRRLERFRETFTPFERDIFNWLEANLSGSHERQLAAAQAMVASDSVPSSIYLIGLHANDALRPHIALTALERSDSIMVSAGWAPQVMQLANTLHLLERYEDELAMLRKRRNEFPSRSDIAARAMRALGALGRREEALAYADTLLRGITDNVGSAFTAMILDAALEFEAHHRDTSTALALAQRVIQWHQSRPPTLDRARLQQEGRAWLLAGNLDSAERAFRQSASMSRALGGPGHLAITLALKGDTTRARALADSIGAENRRWLFGANAYWRAAVLGALGDRDAAVRLLQQAYVAGTSKANQHFALPVRSLRGYPPFDALLVPAR